MNFSPRVLSGTTGDAPVYQFAGPTGVALVRSLHLANATNDRPDGTTVSVRIGQPGSELFFAKAKLGLGGSVNLAKDDVIGIAPGEQIVVLTDTPVTYRIVFAEYIE